MENKKTGNPVRSISLVMLLTLLGKLTGLLRDRMLTVNYGSSLTTSAFLTASRIPRVFFDAMFASAISASFIPVFNELGERRGKEDALDFSANFVSVIGAFAAVITVLGVVFARPLVTLFADGYDAETAALCASLTRVMFPTVLFTAVAYSYVGILQSFERFNLPALISVVANAIVLIYYYTLNSRFGIYGLAIAFLIGWFMQAAIQAPTAHRLGFRFRPDFRLKSEGMKKVFALMLPVMLSTWVQPINLTINSKFGSRLFEGAGVSAVELASNLYLIVIGVFVLSVTNVIFPKLAKLSAADAEQSFGETVRATLHSALYVVMPMTAGLMVLAAPLVRLIYGGGEFGDFSVAITARALVWFSLGMPGYTVQTILSRVYFAEQNGKIPLIAGAASIAVNIALCAVLSGPLDVAGLAVASTAAITVNALILAIPLRKRGIRAFDRELTLNTLKSAAAAVIMAGAAYGALRAVSGFSAGKLGELAAVAVPAVCGVLVYFILTLLLRCTEAKLAAGLIKRK